MVKVSIDFCATPMNPVGAGRYVLELASNLVGLKSEDDFVFIAKKGDSRVDEIIEYELGKRNDEEAITRIEGAGASQERNPRDNVRFRDLELEKFNLARRQFRCLQVSPNNTALRLIYEQVGFPRVLSNEGIDVHHSPHYTMPVFAKVPIIVTIHDTTFIENPQWHLRRKVLMFRKYLSYAAKHASAIVAVSEVVKRNIEKLLNPKCEVVVIPHGVDLETFNPSESRPGLDESVLKLLDINEPYLLYVGTLEPRKNIESLIEGFLQLKRCKKIDQDFKLILAGRDGWKISNLNSMIKESRDVLKLGYVKEEYLPTLMRRSKGVIYPSLEEGFGLPALETLSVGVPLVVVKGSVMAGLAGRASFCAQTGSSNDIAAAIEEALDKIESRQRIDLGKTVAQGYSWKKSAQLHLDLYRKVALGMKS